MDLFGIEIKKLGFGLLRLPQKDHNIDLEQVKIMVDKYMEAGFSYFDTARIYPGSEAAIRRALVERYPRDSFQLASKNAAWMNCKTKKDAEAQFERSLNETRPDILITISCIALEMEEQDFLISLTCGNFSGEKKPKLRSGIMAFHFILPLTNWKNCLLHTRMRNLCSCS